MYFAYFKCLPHKVNWGGSAVTIRLSWEAERDRVFSVATIYQNQLQLKTVIKKKNHICSVCTHYVPLLCPSGLHAPHLKKMGFLMFFFFSWQRKQFHDQLIEGGLGKKHNKTTDSNIAQCYKVCSGLGALSWTLGEKVYHV